MNHVLRRPAARLVMVVAATVALSVFVVRCSVHSATSACGRSAGYWVVSAAGGVYPAGDAKSFGSVADLDLSAPIVAITPTHSRQGYWLLGADGGVFAMGDAVFRGAGVGRHPGPFVALAPTPAGRGYWLLTADGTALGFGDARGRVPVIPARAGASAPGAVGMVASHVPFGGC